MGQVALSALGKGTYVDMVPVHKLILYTQVTIKLFSLCRIRHKQPEAIWYKLKCGIVLLDSLGLVGLSVLKTPSNCSKCLLNYK